MQKVLRPLVGPLGQFHCN